MLADPDKFWNLLSRRQSHIGVEWTSEDVAEYKRYYFTPEGVHAVSVKEWEPGGSLHR
jgi:haloacetate dehalogenase